MQRKGAYLDEVSNPLVPPAASEQVTFEPIPQTSSKPHSGKSECGVQNYGEVNVLLSLQLGCILNSIRCSSKTIDIFDRNRQSGVREHPECNKPGPESLVLIVHCGFLDFLLDFDLSHGTRHGFFECGVNILLDPMCVLNDRGGISVLALRGGDGWKCFSLIATLGTPRDIMQVTECVNIEDVRETHCDTQILEETGEHMPGVSVEERRDEVNPECRNHCSDQCTDRRSEEHQDDLCGGLILQLSGDVRERLDC